MHRGNPAALERALSDGGRALLEELRAEGIARWPRSVRVVVEVVAYVRLKRQVREASGCSKRRAADAAGAALGLDPLTMERLVRTWRNGVEDESAAIAEGRKPVP
jgi:hypothetical protein